MYHLDLFLNGKNMKINKDALRKEFEYMFWKHRVPRYTKQSSDTTDFWLSKLQDFLSCIPVKDKEMIENSPEIYGDYRIKAYKKGCKDTKEQLIENLKTKNLLL